jgi:rfaE bifunctional protein nucleotidyltransferase chain/domain
LELWIDRRIFAFTNGCFDILHVGHLRFLEWASNEAKKHNSYLLVALNTDESVRRLKGAARPINHQEDRAELLSALSCVDAVTFFDEDTPAELLDLLKPRLILKSSQYEGQDTPERRYAEKAEVPLLFGPYVEGKSTTNILQHDTRLKLIADISAFLYESTESFEVEQVGADMAYLLSAIASGVVCEWPEDRPIVALLRKGKSKDHEIWRYIEIEKEE